MIFQYYEGTTTILQEIGSLKRQLQENSAMVNKRLDGNALQNAEVIVSLVEMRKAFKGYVDSLDPDYEMEFRRTLPVKTVEDFEELDVKLGDKDFYKQLVNSFVF